MENKKQAEISSFQKYLTLWVFACMVIGVLIGIIRYFITNFFLTFPSK